MKKINTLGITSLSGNDVVASTVIEQLLISCDLVVVAVRSSATIEKIPNDPRVKVFEDKTPYTSLGRGWDNIILKVLGSGKKPRTVVYPDHDDILPNQWPQYVEQMLESNTCNRVSFNCVLCWQDIEHILPRRFTYPICSHCKIVKWHDKLRFWPNWVNGAPDGHCNPMQIYDNSIYCEYPIRHASMMNSQLSQTWFKNAKKFWRNMPWNIKLFAKIVQNKKTDCISFSSTAKWSEYPW